MALQIRITKGDWWLILIYSIAYRLKTYGSFCCFSARIQLISDIFRQNCWNASKSRHQNTWNHCHGRKPKQDFLQVQSATKVFYSIKISETQYNWFFPTIRLDIYLPPSHFPMQLLSTFCTLSLSLSLSLSLTDTH